MKFLIFFLFILLFVWSGKSEVYNSDDDVQRSNIIKEEIFDTLVSSEPTIESNLHISSFKSPNIVTELDGMIADTRFRKLLQDNEISPFVMNEHLRKCLQEECEFEKIGNIPKIIHFVWFQSPDIPKGYYETLKVWKEHHPDWTIFLWTQVECEELIRDHYAWFLEFYEKYQWMIQKIDAARYFIIYHFGGLVSDIDLAAQKSLTPLITNFVAAGNDVILLPSVNMGGLSNGFAVAAPKNHFHERAIKNLMDPYVPPIIKYTWYLNPAKRHSWIMISAGPRYITNERNRYFQLPKSEQKSSIGLFDPKKFLPCTACTPKPCTCPDCYITMLKGGLWHEKDSKFLDGMRCFFEPLITTRIHVTLLFLLFVFGVLVYIFHHHRYAVVILVSNCRRGRIGSKGFSLKPKVKSHDMKV